MIQIPNKEQFFLESSLYKNETFIGYINTTDQLNECLCLIFEDFKRGNDTKGYYILWKEHKIEITETGRFKQPKLDGFFDFVGKSISRLSKR